MEVKSKNLFELLGNDSDEGSDKEIVPTPKVVEKPIPRTGKRNVPDADPSDSWKEPTGGDRNGRGGRRGGHGNDAAFNDRAAGSENNRGRPAEERRGGARGGRGFRGGRAGTRGDRHNRGLPNDHPKQADQSWGAPTGDAEWKDEQAGEAIAKADEAADPNSWNGTAAAGADAGWADTSAVAPVTEDPAAAGSSWNNEESATAAGTDWNNAAVENPAPAADATPAAAAQPQQPPEAEPEDHTKSYTDYLAEQAEKRAKLGGGPLQARKPNEGSKEDKKWAKAKPLAKDEENDAYIAAKSGKDSKENREKREKPRKEKTRLDVDLRYTEPSGGRGGDRGRGRGRSDYRGGERGRGRGRGGDGFRGGRGDGDHYRGSRGGDRNQTADSVNVSDENAFPSLGGRS